MQKSAETTAKRKRRTKDRNCSNLKFNLTKFACDKNNIKINPHQLCIENTSDDSDGEEFYLTNNCTNSVSYHIECKESTEVLKRSNSTSNDINHVESEFIIYSDDSIIIILNNNEKVYCHGLMTMTVLCGAVNVLGYKLDTLTTTEIYSPKGSPCLFLENCGQSGNVDLSNIPKNFQTKPEIILRNLDKNVAVLLIKKLDETNIKFVQNFFNQPLFPNRNNPQLPQCNFTFEAGGKNVLRISPEWDPLIKKMKQFTKTIICGGKNVGKSTMLRYTINKLLLKYSAILVIDLDPGQPEFTVPGCISACLVKKPVFGPNYTHLRKPDKCVFIANIDVVNNPKLYIECIQHLLEDCEDIEAMPTLINYMGFTQEIGLEIFSSVVTCIKPSCIIEIISSQDQKNFKKNIDHQTICDGAKLFTPNVNSVPRFDLHKVSSVVDTLEQNLDPPQIRELCVLSYLGTMLPKDVVSLLDPRVTTYAVDMSSITVICDGKSVPPAVVNGNFISLCSQRKVNTFTCLGWGVVRAVNINTNQLYILTPLPQVDLEKVCYIVLGSVMLPSILYMTDNYCKGLVPYISVGILTSLGRASKRSYMPANRK